MAKDLLHTFCLLRPDLTVAEAKQAFDPLAPEGLRYGVVVDDAGRPLACLRFSQLAAWPEAASLASLRSRWPLLVALPEASGEDVAVTAAQLEEVLFEQEDLTGVVLVDAAGRPSAVLRRSVLLEALAGGARQRSTRFMGGSAPPPPKMRDPARSAAPPPPAAASPPPAALSPEPRAPDPVLSTRFGAPAVDRAAAPQPVPPEASAPPEPVPEEQSAGAAPEESAAGASPEEPGLVTRYGHLRFPAQVPLYQPQWLIITVNRQQVVGAAGQVALELVETDWPLKVVATLVNVQPEDFLVQGPSSGTLEVPRDGDSPPLTFKLIPQRLGEKTVRVRFEQHNTFLTTARLHTEVVAPQAVRAGSAEVEYLPTLQAHGLVPDFTVYVEHVRDHTYSVSVTTAESDAAEPAERIDEIVFESATSPERYMQVRFEELNARAEGGQADRFDDAVERLGCNLYQKLFSPGGFRDFYWDVLYPASRPQDASGGRPAPTVQIVTEEPHIPWEMLRPFRHRTDGTVEVDPLYFCERFALSRWLAGPEAVPNLSLFKVALVAPPSNLAYVQDEVDHFVRRHRQGRAAVEVIEDLDRLETFLASGEAHVLHFACHGTFEQADPGRSTVVLGPRSYLAPEHLTGRFLSFGRLRPLVFLNACDTGRRGFGLTGLEGWAERFIREARVGCFIGSTWQTTDALACRFAAAFYEGLEAGEAVAEAMRRARAAVKLPGDATYLSYTLYAHPCARAARPAD